MVQADNLSSVLRDFASTLVTDFPIQGILDHLVERIVEILSITGAGVTLISPGLAPHYVAASDEAALRFEQLQTELGQGPCLLAYTSGGPVAVPDLANDTRFPLFGPAAVAAGMLAVFTFPLRHGDGRLGALDLYRDTPGALDPEDMSAAQTLADVAAAYLLNAQARERALDVSDRFRDSAQHDALTGLPNRSLLLQRLAHAAARARRSHSQAAVLFADIDRFKNVNDTYGHAVGDALLIAVAQRLEAVIRPGDTLARLSGDEFVFLCEDLEHVDDVEMLATRIERAFDAPFVVGDTEISVTASVGIAYGGVGEAVTDDLLTNADMAMYQAKRSGGASHKVIDLRAAKVAHDRNRLEQDLAKALPEDQLELAYQPIVRLPDGHVVGVEALLRWTHPQQGSVPAMTTVSIAEQSGMISDIGRWALERGCRDRVQWLADHPDHPLDLAVNVSVRQLMGPGFSETVAAVLDSTGMDPTALALEVTEGIFIADDDDRAINVLADLKSLGVRLALDDFGTGYCSLAYLRRFLVHTIKIDKGFIADIRSDHTAATIVAAVTNLAHDLGMRVTAEGVETRHQLDAVVSMGCDLAQGYLYARPMPSAQLCTRLRDHSLHPLYLPDSSAIGSR